MRSFARWYRRGLGATGTRDDGGDDPETKRLVRVCRQLDDIAGRHMAVARAAQACGQRAAQEAAEGIARAAAARKEEIQDDIWRRRGAWMARAIQAMGSPAEPEGSSDAEESAE